MPHAGYTVVGRAPNENAPWDTDDQDGGDIVPQVFKRTNAKTRKASIGSQYSENILPPLEVIESGKWTFRVCVLGLILCWLTAIGAIVSGAVVQSITSNSDDGYAPSFTRHGPLTAFVQLAVSFWITAVSDIAGLVHSTSLRFTLLASRKLTFNSNLRLFTSCTNSPVHCWPANVVWAWGLISSYACGTMIIVESVYTYFNAADESYQLDVVSGYALIFLGLGLLAQASIATWALMVTEIPSWSTHPIHTAKICQSQGWLAPISRRTMLSVHDAQNFAVHHTPSGPKRRQGSLLKAHFRVRRVLIFSWTVTLLAFLWFISITVAYQVGGGPSLGPSWGSFSRSFTSNWNLIPNWGSHNPTAFLGISTSLGKAFYTFGPWLVCKYLLTSVIIGSITLNLHVVELLVQCSRDESLWRQTTSAGGLGPSKYGALHIAFSTWQTIILFVSKTIIHWIFSLAFGIYYEGVEIMLPQVCYTAVTLFLFSSLATFLALWRPKGPQPATFGHLPSLVDLIDVWPCRVGDKPDVEHHRANNAAGHSQTSDTVTLYWGDKGVNEDGSRRAGTAFARLEPIVMSDSYL